MTPTQAIAAQSDADLIVSELTHRFFNSLQVVDSLFSCAARELPFSDARALNIAVIRDRIQALSRFNRAVSCTAPGAGITEDRCRDVCIDLLRSMGRDDVCPWIRVDDIELPALQASRILMLLAELFLNALKHGDPEQLRIHVDLACMIDGSLLLQVANSCQLYARPLRAPRIAEALANSLGGRLDIEASEAFIARVYLPAGG